MEMVKREDIMLSMPHPRTKNNTGYPDGFKDKAYFKDPHFSGLGYRWGMGIDLSERRLCEYRCLALLDDTLNWYADDPTPPKYLLAISEVQTQSPGDEIYSFAPVSYVKLATVPTPDDASPVIKALMRGDSFVSSGEVLIPSYSVEGTGTAKKIVADVEWTFPLDFVEVVWGDGSARSGRSSPRPRCRRSAAIISRFRSTPPARSGCASRPGIPAGNGALAQPVKFAAPAGAVVSIARGIAPPLSLYAGRSLHGRFARQCSPRRDFRDLIHRRNAHS